MQTVHRSRPQPTDRHVRRSQLSGSLLLALLAGAAQPALAQSNPGGQLGNPDSWVTDEFSSDWGLAAINAQHAYARGLSGKGIRLGIFDSGSATGHEEFAGKHVLSLHLADPGCESGDVLDGPNACFVSDGNAPAIEQTEYTAQDKVLVQYLLDHGYLENDIEQTLQSKSGAQYALHGTHVAGTMLANRDGNGSHGVAWAADLTTARLFSNSYQNIAGMLQDAFWGIDLGAAFGIDAPPVSLGNEPGTKAIATMYQQMADSGVRAINHSWGLSVEPGTTEEMDRAYAAKKNYYQTFSDGSLKTGMLQVFAAGNGSGAIAGIYASLPRYVPELEKYWLSVVNINQTGAIDVSSSICGQSKDWCVAAPGTDITSTIVEGDIHSETIRDASGNIIGTHVLSQSPSYGYGDLTGTSMAAPHVTGALALLMERFPYLDGAQIRDVLLTTTTDLGAAGIDDIYGWGLINLKKAIDGPGSLRVDTAVVMNQRAGGAKTWNGNAWDDWRNDIAGPGRLTKDGIGWLRLSGDNTFAGASVRNGILELTGANHLSGEVSVDGNAIVAIEGSLDGSALRINQGSAVVNGRVSNGLTSVAANGRLSGTGRLGDTIVQGTIAPGNSIGTLTIDGNYSQLPGSVYAAELGTNRADLLAVKGHAELAGGTLRLSSTPGVFLLGNRYRLLSADGGVDGAFDGVDSSPLSPFLSARVSYANDSVGLTMQRGAALASAAASANQSAVASTVDALDDSAPLLQRMVLLSADQARPVFDALGGEIHASAKALLMQDSRIVRDSALARARAGHDTFSAQASTDATTGAWAEVQHASSRLDSDGNAAEARLNGNTTLIGADFRFDNGWRIGALGGGGRSDVTVPQRNAKAKVHATYAGIYAGQQWQHIGLRLGYTQAWQELDSHRQVTLSDLSEAAHGRYDARTRQAFVEAGYRFAIGRAGIEPFAQFAQVTVKTDGVSEQGGLTALTLGGDSQTANLSSAGVRFNADLASHGQAQSWLSLRASLAYRHASGDYRPDVQARLSASDVFSVSAAPLARNATLAELGVAARLSANTLLEFGYNGLFARSAHDTGLNARFSVQF